MSETSDKKLGMSTRCVHAGDGLDAQGGIHAPLYNHSTFGMRGRPPPSPTSCASSRSRPAWVASKVS